MDEVAAKLPSHHINISRWNIPPGLSLADPHFNQAESIDMIIGAEHFYTFFPTAERIYLADKLPILINSVFGWLVVGPASEEVVNPHSNPTRVSMVSLEEKIEQFWKAEELHACEPYSVEEKHCEELYRSKTGRNSDGRYVVQMPKHPEFSVRLGESKGQALRRFYSLEKRLSRNSQLKKEYHAFMQEYIDLGHMQPVNENASSPTKTFYLPHHPVIKESSSTTKVRVVFDGSAKTSTGYSLNEALCVGPIVQDELLDIILRFRTYFVALVGDIEKMYRQILLHEDDRALVRILFRFSSTSPVKEYELNTVTYGLAPSSFLATRTLLQLVQDEGSNYPLASRAIRNFYVDDFIGGASSVEEAIQLRSELTGMMLKGGFPLRKWTSNRLEVLQELDASQIGTKSSLQFDTDETIKALGVCWEPERDNLCFASSIKPLQLPSTKRSICSEIARLFDPLGLIAPVVVRAKIMMQQLWALSIGWDETVPESFGLKWKDFYEKLEILTCYRIERYCFALRSNVQLHIFTDASESAYGSCVYARCEDAEGNIKISLLASKSRVAPLKRISLPRLELCGAVLGAHLYEHIAKAIQLPVQSVHFWSDSSITLHWIKAAPNTWKTYVANRVADIQQCTKGHTWRHVPGQQNPADLVSRGMTAPDFIKSSIWISGPAWLALPSNEWPTSEPLLPTGIEKETRLLVAVASASPAVNPWFKRWSSYSQLLHIIAYCKRFIKNLRLKARTKPAGDPVSIVLTPEQNEEAKAFLVKTAQDDAFRNEISALRNGQPIKKNSPIRNLNPFLDNQGVLRVGGRLNLADLPFQSKHPALLPKGHPFTRNIVVHYHWKLLHAGGRNLISNIREEFWPLDARRLVRSITRECFRCFRSDPFIACQRIGQLPASRVTPSRPFSNVGIDYAGPFYLKPVHRRAAACKAYLCLFVCFATKAVHLELVCDLSTSAFLAALRRFIARRGKPCHIHSDNGKNFEGASNEITELASLIARKEEEQQVNEFCTSQGISWHFNPPRAPHFGGLWESAVKVAKRHLYRILGASRLSFEDLYTILTQIEAVMNSRPLLPLSENPDELAALTPGHFLIGTSMQALPEPNLCDVPLNRLEHYWKLQAYVQRFWVHWKGEYLQELQKDTVGHEQNPQFTIGRMVILIDELLPATRWPLARIVETHAGRDGITRVVSVRTSKGIYKRPITKICLLPIPSSIDNAASEEVDLSKEKLIGE
uniref:uncharacterized protein LOC120961699 isoform X1 n=1 Tax=Anopheles coluzzii TaxID=1518534 RepID=UPI0020FFDF6A|nr:uncharacterized protein LOC120961699 isoform X1 [Anopheles coluzzii]XP_049461104.1 uncharacterized protein LOC125906417 isoform X1 [Anopheles coluzzii]XP_049463243.1 uncharacterized protein LOC120950902 isoform X1 [Anopheles coluzzii]XP_049464286.1 uncharacterized protein LOC125907234 isoform X1 [Anopheles coluzzii]